MSDGSPYLVAGPNVVISSQSNGQITISSAGGAIGNDFHKEMLSNSSTAGVTDYALQNMPSDGDQVQVYVNGMLLLSGSSCDYVYDAVNNQIDFNNAPEAGSVSQSRSVGASGAAGEDWPPTKATDPVVKIALFVVENQ